MVFNTLTKELILEKTKVTNLADVRHLDLWGCDLSDVSAVNLLTNIEILAFAANHISSLKYFAQCYTLQELYLRKNDIANLKEVTSLKDLKRLHTLWLMENACATHPFYREFVLHCCTGLKKLDDTEVTAEERAQAARRMSPRVIDSILGRNSAAATVSPIRLSTSPSRNSVGGGHTSADFVSGVQVSKGSSSAANAAGGTRQRGAASEGREGGDDAILFTTVQAQRAMITSIVALLPELTVESLELVRREVQERIGAQQKKITQLSQA